MKVAVYTLGCKVNSYESEYVTNLFKQANYEIVSFNEKADIYIINTCTVTNNSDSKSRKIIREAIRNNPKACIVAMGCFIESSKDNLIDGINICIGNKDKSKIVSLVEEYMKEHKDINHIIELDKEFEDMYISTFGNKTRAFVKIQDGCENYCTYCIIPYVRGKCRSKKLETVVKEITDLVNNGYKEIVLTGIHTGSYGIDINVSFSKLLEELVKIPNLYRLRISSIEVTELNKEVLEVLKNSKIICNHLHIPLQAGSNEILKLMNRKYDLDYFYKKIEEIRTIRPDIAISTDIIVGFPGETEELFKETLGNSKKIGFSKIHVFPYSERRGTPAEKFKGKVEVAERKERSRRLIALSEELEKDYMEKFINKELEVLIETTEDNYSIGHTSNYLLVKVEGKYKQEEIINVLITEVDYPYVKGKVI